MCVTPPCWSCARRFGGAGSECAPRAPASLPLVSRPEPAAATRSSRSWRDCEAPRQVLLAARTSLAVESFGRLLVSRILARSGRCDPLFSKREGASTRPLPCARCGNRAQSAATVLAHFGHSGARPFATVCHRLQPRGSIKAPSYVAEFDNSAVLIPGGGFSGMAGAQPAAAVEVDQKKEQPRPGTGARAGRCCVLSACARARLVAS
jgi:hypothetical protein